MQILSSYLPNDRRYALAQGTSLPEHARGTVLFADISGFTALTSTFARTLGARRGAEELTHHLNDLYDALIGAISRWGGSVVGFSGDALTCWFDDALSHGAASAVPRAIRCALDLQAAMHQRSAIIAPDGTPIQLRLKIGMATGAVRRFVVGDPAIQQIDVLAGTLLDRMAEAEHLATGGEIIVDQATATAAGAPLAVQSWRTYPTSGQDYAVVGDFGTEVAATPWPALDASEEAVAEQAARTWLLPAVRERIARGQEHFLAEFRPAVALFVAFSGIDYDRSPAAGAHLDAFVRSTQQVLQRFGGSLIQLTIGDKGSYGYAVFGAPIAQDDHARSAMEAAQALLALPESHGAIADIRIGLAEGVMWTGAYGSPTQRTYGVMGNKTNLAARLMQQAPVGTIACDEEIVGHLRGRWQFEPLPPLPLKTPGTFANAYRATGAHDTTTSREQSAFIGRRAEVERVIATLQTMASGTGRTVLIEGEAGIGKSRLVSEIVEHSTSHDIANVAGAGRAIEQQTPYRAWRDVFARLIDIEDEDDITARTTKVAATLTTDVPALADRLPLLREFLNIDAPDNDFTQPLDPAQRSENLQRLLIELVRVRATAQPLVIVLEDAHWLDSRSWELAGRLARTLLDVPLLLLLTTRPLDADYVSNEIFEQVAALSTTERITLEAMDDAETVRLAAARLGVDVSAVPPAITTLLRTRAGGNPFFAEELIAALQESGMVRVDHDPVLGTLCHAVGDLEQMQHALPATLQGLILSRIDRLPWDQQLTLKVASVIGARFGVAPLLYMRNIQDVITLPTLDEHLSELTTRDFTLPEPEADPLYRFRHVLTQEAAYEMLLFAQRRTLHRLVAQWYEHTYGDDEADLAPYLPLLAFHYRYAEDAERERTYARLAGQQAARQFANTEATEYFGRALLLTPDDDLAARFDLLLEREAVYNIQGARDPQRADLDTLADLTERLDDDRRRAEVALRRAYYEEWTGQYAAMAASSEQALQLAQSLGWTAGQAMASLRLGRSYTWRSLFEPGVESLLDALRLASNGVATDVEAEGLRSLGLQSRQQGKIDESRAYYNQALECFRAINNRSGEALTLNNLGILANEQGDNTAARRWYEQALRIMFAMGDRRGEAIMYCNLGMVALDDGDVFGALAQFERSLALNIETRDLYSESISVAAIATTQIALGDYAPAREQIDRSYQIRIETGDQEGESIMLAAKAHLMFLDEDFEQALTYAQQALAMASDLNLHLEIINARVEVGYALNGLRRWQEALEVYERAWTDHGTTPRMGRDIELRTYVAHAAWMANDQQRAREHLDVIVPYLLQHFLDCAYEPFMVYAHCYDVLKALGDPRAAPLITVAHERLQALAAQIDDPERRAHMLEHVAVHRAIVAGWNAEQASLS